MKKKILIKDQEKSQFIFIDHTVYMYSKTDTHLVCDYPCFHKTTRKEEKRKLIVSDDQHG